MITITEAHKLKAKQISLELLGKENISALFTYWLNKFEKSPEFRRNSK